jgi:hypothetical protein
MDPLNLFDQRLLVVSMRTLKIVRSNWISR